MKIVASGAVLEGRRSTGVLVLVAAVVTVTVSVRQPVLSTTYYSTHHVLLRSTVQYLSSLLLL